MSDDLIPFESGELAPLAAPDLVPADTTWTVPDSPDYLGEYHSTTPTVFGQEIANVSPAQVEQMLGEICTLYINDAAQMGIDPSFARAAVDWYKQAASAPIPHEYANHGYDLRGFTFPRNDQPFVVAFCNFAAGIGASERDVRGSLRWAGSLTQRIQQTQQPHQPQRQQAATVDSLTDAEYKIVEARAERDRQNAEGILRQKWGNQFEQKMAVVRNHVRSLPAQQREWLNSAVAQGGLLLANAPETVERLYQEAIGSTVNPNNLGAEIAALEDYMRRDRRGYNANLQAQERLRFLYQLRDGG